MLSSIFPKRVLSEDMNLKSWIHASRHEVMNDAVNRNATASSVVSSGGILLLRNSEFCGYTFYNKAVNLETEQIGRRASLYILEVCVFLAGQLVQLVQLQPRQNIRQKQQIHLLHKEGAKSMR